MNSKRKVPLVWGVVNTTIGGILGILWLVAFVGVACSDPRQSAEPPMAAGIRQVILVLLLILLPWWLALFIGGIGLRRSTEWGRPLTLAWAWVTLLPSLGLLLLVGPGNVLGLVCLPLLFYSFALLWGLSAPKRDSQGGAGAKEGTPGRAPNHD